jgi:hypothetical protein
MITSLLYNRLHDHRRGRTFRAVVGLTAPVLRVARPAGLPPPTFLASFEAAAGSSAAGSPPGLVSRVLAWRFARPSSHLFTRLAKRSEQIDSPDEDCAGDMLESIRVLQLPPRQGCARTELSAES